MTADNNNAPTRSYVCLEQQKFEDNGEVYFVERGQVEARNGQNALRKAYRELLGGQEGSTTLVVIPESGWKPKLVKGTRRPDITVSIGA